MSDDPNHTECYNNLKIMRGRPNEKGKLAGKIKVAKGKYTSILNAQLDTKLISPHRTEMCSTISNTTQLSIVPYHNFAQNERRHFI